MPYAITAPMIGDGASLVRNLWRALAENGLASDILELDYQPHVTLAVIDRETEATELFGVLSAVCDPPREPIPIRLHGFLTFPGRMTSICLAPTVSEGLTKLHRRVLRALAHDHVRDHYREGRWVPHVTLTKAICEASQIGECMRVLSSVWQPTEARLESIELIRFRPVEVLMKSNFS